MHASTISVAWLLLSQIAPTQPATQPSILPLNGSQTRQAPGQFSTSPALPTNPGTGSGTSVLAPTTTPTFQPLNRQIAPPTPIGTQDPRGQVPIGSGQVIAPPATNGLKGSPPPASVPWGPPSSPTPTPSTTTTSPGTGSPQASTPRAWPGSATSAKAILNGSLSAPAQSTLQGISISLLQAIEKTNDRRQQLEIVKTYWRLSLGMADYHHSLDELGLLSKLSTPHSTYDQAVLNSGAAAARARVEETTLAANAAQHDLAGVASLSDGVPVPSDPPYVGRYLTRFETLFASRPAPAGLRRLNVTLPLYLKLVEARAQSVDAADQEVRAAVSAYQGGQLGASNVLDAIVRLRDQRIAFLAAVRDYNDAIAEYALNAAGSGISRQEVVSMLIDTKNRSSSGSELPNRAVDFEQPIGDANTRPSLNPALGTSANLVPVIPPQGFVPVNPQSLSPVTAGPAGTTSILLPQR